MHAAKALDWAVGRFLSCLAAALAPLVGLAPGAAAVPIVMRFDERLAAPADGLSLLGVTFGVSSAFPEFASQPGFGGDPISNQTYLSGDALIGSELFQEDQLVLDFGAPTGLLEFGVMLEDGFDNQITVDLFDASLSLIASIPMTLANASGLNPEALFHYDGAAVSRAVLSFDPFARLYAIDNLTFENTAVDLVRSTGANGAEGSSGSNAGPGGSATAVANTGRAIEHAVATGGNGGYGGFNTGRNGGNGGAANAQAVAQTSGAVNASATAVARGGDGGGSGSNAAPGAGGNATSSAQATSTSGSATAIAESEGGTGSSGGGATGNAQATSGSGAATAIVKSIGAADGVASGTASAVSTQGGDATASIDATGGRGRGSSSGAAGDGADTTLVNAADGSTSGKLLLIQAATGGRGGDASSAQASPGAGGDATSWLTRSKSASSLELRVRATGGFPGFQSGNRNVGDPVVGGRADARADATNDAGSVLVDVGAAGGGGATARGTVAAGAGGDALAVARGETLGDGHAVVVRSSGLFAAVGGRGGDISFGATTSGRGGNATSQSTGIARGDSEVTVVDSARGGEGGAPFRVAGSGGAGGDATSTATGSNVGNGKVSVAANATGGLGGQAEGAGNKTGDGGAANADASGSSSGSGEVSVEAVAVGGEGGHNFAADSTTLTGESGGLGGSAQASATGSSQDGNVTVSASQTGGRGGTIRDGGTNGDGADSTAIDAVSGSTSGLLDLSQTATGGSGGGSVNSTGPAGAGGDAVSRLTASNPGGGALTAAVTATGGAGSIGSVGGAAGNATAELTGSSSDAALALFATATGGASGTPRSSGPGVSGGNALALARGTSSGTAISAVHALASGGANPKPFVNITTTDSRGGDAEARAVSSSQVQATADAIVFAGRSDNTGRSGLGIAHTDADGPAGWANAEAYADAKQALFLTARAHAPVASPVSVESRAAAGRAADSRAAAAGLEAFSFVTGTPGESDVASVLAGNERVSAHVPPSMAIAMGFTGFSPDQVAAAEPLHTETVLTLQTSKFPIGSAIRIGFLDPEITGAFGSLRLLIKRNALVLLDQTFSDAASVDAFFDDQFLELANAASGYALFETFELLFDLEGHAAGSAFRVGYMIGTVPEPSTALLLALGLAMLGRRRSSPR